MKDAILKTYRKLPELEEAFRELYMESEAIISPEEVLLNIKMLQTYKALLRESYENLQSIPDWVNQLMFKYYLKNRLSLSFHSNYAILWKEDLMHSDIGSRAVSIILSCLDFFLRERGGKLKKDTLRGSLVGMEQYKRLFCSSRIPNIEMDLIAHFSDSSHIVIACRGNFYEVKIDLTDIYSMYNSLNEIIKSIVEDSTAEEYVGFLSSLSREEWFKYRNLLLRSGKNAQNIKIIDQSIFLVCIDLNLSTNSLSQSFFHVQHGNPANRWFDKSHQIIITNGMGTGICVDHAFVDGNAAARYSNEVSASAQNFSPKNKDLNQKLQFQKLQWEISDEVYAAIETAKSFHKKESSQRELRVFSIPIPKREEYKEKNIGQDAFLQAGIQLGLREYAKKNLTVNEAVLMTHFKDDRYDTAFTVTREMINFLNKVDSGVFEIADLQLVQRGHLNRLNLTREGKSPVFFITALIISQIENRLKVEYKGLEADNKILISDTSLYKILETDATTSSLADLPYIYGFSFTDVNPGIIGIAYTPKDTEVQFALKTDGHWFGSGHGIEEKFRVSFKILNDTLKK